MSKSTVNGWPYVLYPGSSNVGLVLVHEIFGLDDYAKSVGDQLARNGYWAAVVDMYRGKSAASLEEGFKLRSSLTEDEIAGALKGGLQLLKEKMGASAKIGTMGFCMGGGFALLGACSADFAFCIDYYGLIEDADKLEGIKGPIAVILGSEDERVTPWAYQHLLPAATKHKKRVDVHLYPNARHAFHRPNWEGHNPQAAKDAWNKTLIFLSQFKQ